MSERAISQSLAMRKLHHMTIWITNDAQITGIGVQKRGTEFQQTVLFSLAGYSDPLFAGSEVETQMASRTRGCGLVPSTLFGVPPL